MMDRPDANVELERFLIARRAEYTRESRTATAYGLAMMTLALLGKWPMLRTVTAILACLRGFAAYFIMRHQRTLNAIATSTQQSANASLEIILSRDSAFVKSSFYWYALPHSLGFVGIAFAIWRHARSIPMVVLCVILAIGTAVGTRRMNVQKLGELESIRATVLEDSDR